MIGDVSRFILCFITCLFSLDTIVYVKAMQWLERCVVNEVNTGLSSSRQYVYVSLDVCKRSARFILSCLKSKPKVVRSVASFSVLFGRHESIIGRNAIFCCSQFNWNFSDFFLSTVDTRSVKFCIIIICMMLMTVIGVVPLYWLNLSPYAMGCQILVFFSDGSMFAYDDVCDLILHFALS